MDVLLDALIDSVKLIPFLIVTFLILEFFEHKLSEKSKNKIASSGKFGPLIGGFLGLVPQCGFSVSATHLYATKVISLGTLISVYLSTSDEMLAILLSNGVSSKLIISILLIKVFIAIIFGYFINIILKEKLSNNIKNFCDEEECHCENGILASAITHTIQIFIHILSINIILGFVLNFIDLTMIKNSISILEPVIVSLIGLIPNCASSVAVTELYLNDIISFGSFIAGLLVNSGIALGVLFKVNKDMKENAIIIALLLTIGSLTGYVINILGSLS